MVYNLGIFSPLTLTLTLQLVRNRIKDIFLFLQNEFKDYKCRRFDGGSRMGKENIFQQKENKAFDMELFDHDLKATPTTRHHQTGPMRYCN